MARRRRREADRPQQHLGHWGDTPAAAWVFTADTGAAIKGFALGALAKAGSGHPAVQGWYADFLRRAFVVEVMGRASGYLALMSAIATGAELAIVPERALHPEVVAEDMQRQYARGKLHYIIVVAGGRPWAPAT